MEIEPGRSPDGATSRQDARRGKGSLRISDLGYFKALVFAALTTAGAYFLSRLPFGVHVLLGDDRPVEVLRWLAEQRGPFVERPILLGEEQRWACRLLAWRLPAEQAQRRRQKLRQATRSKKGRAPSAARLAWCDGTILVTNVPVAMRTPKEATVGYRARWQVELLFKRWQAQGLVAERSGSTVVRQLVRVGSRLLAVVVQHWLVIASVGGNPRKSLGKAYEAVRDFAGRWASALIHPEELERVLDDVAKTLAKTCRRDPRSKPGTFESLNDPELLDFCLT